MHLPDSTTPLAGLRVVHVSSVHHLDDTRIRIKECRSLRDAGAHVTLIARPGAGPVPQDGVISIEAPQRNRWARLLTSGWSLARQVRSHQPDLVHFHDPELLPFAKAFARDGAKVIYDVHEDLPRLVLARTWIHRRVRSTVSKLAARVEPLLARACSGFVFVEPHWADRFPDRPHVLVRNAAIVGEFRTENQTAPDTPPASVHFVYVGAISRSRGAVSAVEAINRLDFDARLTLAGPVESDDLRQQLLALDIHDRLALPGVVDREHVAVLLKSATAGLALLEPTPAYDSARATKLAEYMAVGLPLLLSDTTAHRALIEQASCGLLADFGDPGAIAANMTAVTDAATWQALAAASWNALASEPTWESESSTLIDLYRQLLAR